MTQSEILLAARQEWLHMALSENNPDRWIEVEELYNKYMKHLGRNELGVWIDEINRDEFRDWIMDVDFVDFKIFPKKHANNIRKYRLKKEESKSCLTKLGQRVKKLKYIISGIAIFSK